MIIKCKIIEITSSNNGIFRFKFYPDEGFHDVIPNGGINQIGTYGIALGKTTSNIQKGMKIEMDGSFKINNYKVNNFAKKYSPKLNFHFNKIDVIEGFNSEEGLKDFIIKEIPYIGDKLARYIFKKYTPSSFTKLFEKEDNEIIKELTQIDKIGKKKATIILENWKRLEDRRVIYSKLFQYGLSVGKVVKIYEKFGKSTIKRIEDNPYIITRIKGISFEQAEALAIKFFNIPKDSIHRYNALIDFQVQELCKQDTIFSLNNLKSLVKNYLLNDDFHYKQSIEEIIGIGIKNNIENDNIIKINEDIYMLKNFYDIENYIYEKIKYQLNIKNKISIDFEKIEGYDILTLEQKEAVKNSLSNGISILKGEAGTGKTTTTRVILNGIRKLNKSYAIVSPTNKAVKRIKEVNSYKDSSGNIKTIDAYTIHSLLGLTRSTTEPTFNEKNPLNYDYLLIDESSMMGEYNASLLLRALKPGASICYIGDNNQLVSIEAGSFYNDLLEGSLLKEVTVSLGIVKRANLDEGVGEIIPKVSNLVANSQKILKGQKPISTLSNTYCRYYEENNLEMQNNIILNIKNLYDKMISKNVDYNKNYQILCPNYGGVLGIDNLNKVFSEYLNGDEKQFNINGRELRRGDKVYYDNKNEEFGLVKGDTGIIKKIDNNLKQITIYFYDLEKECNLHFIDVENIKLGYCMSIHKSQGSEFDYTTLILTSSSFSLLNMNILYTGYTRGKKKVYLMGDKIGITIALNNKESSRNTLLFNLLNETSYEDIEITKTREIKGITINQVKFIEKKLNTTYRLNGTLIKVKPIIQDLIGFKYIFVEKKFAKENNFYEKMNIDLDFYNKYRFDKNIRFIRIDNSGKEPNGFYKSKLYNNFNHFVIGIIEENNLNKIKIYWKKNIINDVF